MPEGGSNSLTGGGKAGLFSCRAFPVRLMRRIEDYLVLATRSHLICLQVKSTSELLPTSTGTWMCLAIACPSPANVTLYVPGGRSEAA